MIKLIASDLDGTLLQNEAQELTPRAIELIRALTQKGVILLPQADASMQTNDFSSRDQRRYLLHRRKRFSVHSSGESYSRGLIEDDLAYRILRELKKEPGFEIVVSREDTCLIENNNSQFANHIVNVMHNTTEIVDDLLTVKGPFLKIAFANMTSRRTTDCLKELQEKFSSEIKVVTSGNIWIDFIVPGCNKGSALRNLMDLFGITPEECVAFGDQYNDVEMLETVGMGYAMSNAAPGIAGHAKYITDSVEEVLEDILAGLDL